MSENMVERVAKQDAFIRVCSDSGYSLEASQAANIAAKVLGCSPLEIWTAFGELNQMDRIADGSHPALSKAT